MKQIKSTLFILALMIALSSAYAQPCANAGSDELVCGYTYDLIGAPPGGSWTVVCGNPIQFVHLDSILPGTSKVTVSNCGAYTFVYHVDELPCVSTDTVVIQFENRSFKLEDAKIKIDLKYQSLNCHVSPEDSCGNIRTVAGIFPPTPTWILNLNGNCEVLTAKQKIVGADSTSCLADSIIAELSSKKDTALIKWTSTQQSFISLDSNGKLINNRFGPFIGILLNSLIDELDTKCNLNKCFTDFSICRDTVLYDTLNLIIPVHLGGSWHLKNGNMVTRLNNSNFIRIGTENYYLNILKGARYYGPDALQFELLSTDASGNPIPLNKKIDLELVWQEDWITDTITYYLPKEINDENCFCGGRTIFIDRFTIPETPFLVCPPNRLVFTPTLTPEILGKDYFCAGQFLNLSVDSTYSSFKWSNGTFEKNTSISSGGKVSVTVTNSYGCEATDTLLVYEVPLPSIEITSDKNAICQGDCVILELKSESFNTFIWNNTDTTKTIIACPTIDRTYTGKVIDLYGCESTKNIDIKVHIAPDPNAGLDQKLTCTVHSVNLNPARLDTFGKRSFFWTGPGITSLNRDTINPLVSTPGQYVLHVFDSISGCIGIDSIEVIADTLKPLALGGPDLVLNCKDLQVTFKSDSSTFGNGFSIEWYGPGINPSNRFILSPTVNLPGTYLLNITNLDNNCSSVDTIVVTLNNLTPRSDAGLDRVIPCDSTELLIGGTRSSVGSAISYLWQGPAINTNNQNNQFVLVNAPGVYTLIVTNNITFCTDTDQVIISLPDSLPTIKLFKSWDFSCLHDSVFLSADSSTGRFLQYLWNGPGITTKNRKDSALVIFSPGIYYLLLRDSVTHCTSFDSIEVKITGSIPTVNAGPDKTITCDFPNVTLNGSSNLTDSLALYTWTGQGINDNNKNQKTPVVNQDGEYILTVKNIKDGCTVHDTLYVKKNLDLPSVDIGVDHVLNCRKDTLQLEAILNKFKSNYSFKWTGAGINPNNERDLKQVIRIPGIYSVSITTPNPECNAVDMVNITIDTNTYKISIEDTLWFSCDNKIISFREDSTTFTKLDSISWSDALDNRIPTNDKGRSITLTKEGRYKYLSYQKNGCFTFGSFVIIPYTTIKVDQVIVNPSCLSHPTGSIKINVLEGTGPFKYSLDGSPADTISFFSQLIPGIYNINIYDRFGCPKLVTVEIKSLIVLPTTLDNQTLSLNICQDTIIDAKEILRRNNFNPDSASYQWSFNGTDISIGQSMTKISATGRYAIKFINKNGCETVTVFYNVTQDNNINTVTNEFNLCQDTIISADSLIKELGLKPSDVTIQWKLDNVEINNGQSSLKIDKAGTFELIIINSKICETYINLFVVTQDNSMADSRVNMPNVFTPNGDQINDTYKPVFDKMTTFETYLFTIYDRWGQKVFETSDPKDSWDGRRNSTNMPIDSYIALFRARLDLCGSMRDVNLKTSFTLIR